MSENQAQPSGDAASTVLVVDHSGVVRSTLRAILGQGGYRVLEAEGARQAQQAMAENMVGVMLTDLMMGGEDGVEFARQLRPVYPYLKVVLISGAFGANPPHPESLGADALLGKLASPEQIRETVGRLLRRR